MEENKYYTPEISEFHVGFECEVYHHYSESEGFDKEVYDELTPIWYNRVKYKLVMVKYLDREDIESLGWEFQKQYPGLEEINFEKDDLILDYDLESNYLRIYWTGQGDVTRFSGFIKNKSELRRLMGWLGINPADKG